MIHTDMISNLNCFILFLYRRTSLLVYYIFVFLDLKNQKKTLFFSQLSVSDFWAHEWSILIKMDREILEFYWC